MNLRFALGPTSQNGRCIEQTDQLLDGRQSGSWPETALWEAKDLGSGRMVGNSETIPKRDKSTGQILINALTGNVRSDLRISVHFALDSP
jgi:hypothetical protein